MRGLLRAKSQKKIRVFYDGTCGLCHRFVRFSLFRIKAPNHLYFSPFKGPTFNRIKKHFPHEIFYDRIIVYEEDKKKLLQKSEAIIKILSLLNQPWKAFASVLKVIPLPISNVGYDVIARIRHRLFKTPKQSCPIPSEKWMKYFED